MANPYEAPRQPPEPDPITAPVVRTSRWALVSILLAAVPLLLCWAVPLRLPLLGLPQAPYWFLLALGAPAGAAVLVGSVALWDIHKSPARRGLAIAVLGVLAGLFFSALCAFMV